MLKKVLETGMRVIYFLSKKNLNFFEKEKRLVEECGRESIPYLRTLKKDSKLLNIASTFVGTKTGGRPNIVIMDLAASLKYIKKNGWKQTVLVFIHKFPNMKRINLRVGLVMSGNNICENKLSTNSCV